MKAKLGYTVLVVSILGLLVAAGILVKELLQLDEETQLTPSSVETPSSSLPAAMRRNPSISETIIVAHHHAIPAPVASPAAPLHDTATTARDTSQPVAQVSLLRGDASAQIPTGPLRPLIVTSRLFMHDLIKTGTRARIQLRFLDGSILSQGPHSNLVIDEFVYTAGNAKQNVFGIRPIKGMCRIISGAISDLNPDQFRVRTRMATMGIRGCDVAVNTQSHQDDLYVLDLPPGKVIRVDTSADGSILRDAMTGRELPMDPTKRTTFDITEPHTHVAMRPGRPPQTTAMTLKQVRAIVEQVELRAPIPIRIMPRPDGAVFIPGQRK